ncbi:hypothetical protein HY417_00565 [Candidatus Kaiserbacteria bacterium]|nr:hypothetical protein [Candidatus Kaiserbacteria bacterium]
MVMRYATVFFLVALLLGILGLVFGYLSLDVTAPLDRQLTATGALAYNWQCYDGECVWVDDEEGELQVLDAIDREYDRELEMIDRVDEMYDRELYYPEEVYGEDPRGNEEPFWWLDPEREGAYVVEEWEEWEEPLAKGGGWYDEWIEDEYWFDEPRAAQNSQNPWYVSAFPGIGQMVQQIIPGQSVSVRAPMLPPRPPRPAQPQPSCWITAQPMSVGYGGSSTLSWSSFNATRASLTDFGTMPLSGSRVINNIRNDRMYQLSVTGAGGSGSCYTRITVRPQSVTPSCVISAYPSAIHVGQSSSLAWGSENASAAYLSGVGSVSPQGGTYVTPNKTTTYVLNVFGSQGASGSCMAEVGVLP